MADNDEAAALEPIHRAAVRGDLAQLNRLIDEDGRRLNEQGQRLLRLNDITFASAYTPLKLAAWKGHDEVVARLIELGAEIEDEHRPPAMWACYGNQPSTLALLLDAGISFNARVSSGRSLLMTAAWIGSFECAALLIRRGGDALELDAINMMGSGTALHEAALYDHPAIVQLLLQAGANPTIRDNVGYTPLDAARLNGNAECIALLQAALVEPQRPRALHKARSLADAARAVTKARTDSAADGEPLAVQRAKARAAAPAYLKRRVEEGQQLPRVSIADKENEKRAAVLRFVLDADGEGLPPELFTELLYMLVPKWDPSRKGLPLGQGL